MRILRESRVQSVCAYMARGVSELFRQAITHKLIAVDIIIKPCYNLRSNFYRNYNEDLNMGLNLQQLL